MPGIGIGISPHFQQKKSLLSYWTTRKPTLLVVTGMRDTEMDFAWTDNSAGDVSFKIYKSTDGVTYAADGTTLAGVVSYTATGLTAGVLYYFYVVGVKNGNESDPTNIYDTRFKITIDTTKAGSAADTFILPTSPAGTFNAYVDWGDGGAEENITGAPGNVSHTYSTSGTYQIKIRGAFPYIYFNNGGDKLKLITIDNWGNIAWGAMGNSFYGCSNLNGNWNDVPNLTLVGSLANMFRSCSSFNYPINFQTTASVANLTSFLQSATSFNSSLAINSVSCTNFTSFLRGCTDFNQPLTGISTAAATNLSYFINGCTSLKQSLETLDLVEVTDMTNFGVGVNLNEIGTTANYDATLISWAAQDVTSGLAVILTSSKYSSAAVAARATLTDTKTWTITDDGISYVATFFGDSITAGGYASPLSEKFTTKYCGLDELKEVNHGDGGQELMQNDVTPDGESMYEHIADIPEKTAYDVYLFFEFGANDCVTYPGEEDRFYTEYIAVIDAAIAKGWAAAEIVLLTAFRPGYSDPVHSSWNDKIVAVGVAKSVQVIDTATALYNGGSYSEYMFDSVHPNNAGHLLMAQTIDANIV